MIKRFQHSLRFKLTMLLMIMMTMTVFSSLAVTQLSVKAYFLSELKHRMIGMYEDINMVFITEGLTDEEIREHLSKLAADGEIDIFVLCQDGTIYSNINEKSRMWDSMQLIANLLEGKDLSLIHISEPTRPY